MPSPHEQSGKDAAGKSGDTETACNSRKAEASQDIEAVQDTEDQYGLPGSVHHAGDACRQFNAGADQRKCVNADRIIRQPFGFHYTGHGIVGKDSDRTVNDGNRAEYDDDNGNDVQ